MRRMEPGPIQARKAQQRHVFGMGLALRHPCKCRARLAAAGGGYPAPAARQPSRRRLPRRRRLTTSRTPGTEISISTEIAIETPRSRTPCPVRYAQRLPPKQQLQRRTTEAETTRRPRIAGDGAAQSQASPRHLPKRRPHRAWCPPRAPSACSPHELHRRRHVPRAPHQPIRERTAVANGLEQSEP